VGVCPNSNGKLHPSKVAQQLVNILLKTQHLESLVIEVNIHHKPLLKANKLLLLLLLLLLRLDDYNIF
jgi:hypothetical protein